MSDYRSLGEVLVEMGLLTPETLEQNLTKQSTQKERLGEILVKDGVISDRDLARALGLQHGVDFLALDHFVPSPDALAFLSEKTVRAHRALPVEFKEDMLTLAFYDPLEAVKLEPILKMSGVGYRVTVSTLKAIQQAIETAFGCNDTIEKIVENLVKPRLKSASAGSPMPEEASASIERLIDKIIARAVEDHASDIHIDPADSIARIRIRVDGILHVINTYPLEIHSNVVSRLKVLARMDISEKRVPQDGRFPYAFGGRNVDIRISTLPTIKGEKAVMRIIDKSSLKGSFEALGMDPETEKSLCGLLATPHGILFVTGPTGSGKTTTLYAMISHVNDAEKNIITVEDPVEYQFDVVNQVQVHEKAGLGFIGLLRNILRQDPDILMIGEVRDKETADIAFQAALTGHLVLSTLHTNDAVSAPTRLIDIGIEPFLLCSAMLGVLSQRLVRVLCTHCKQETKLKEEQALLLGKDLVQPGARIFARKGCEKCYNTGYLGRVSLFELLIPDKAIQKAIADRKPESDLLAIARKNGFKTMRQDGIAKILAGVTSVEEVIKVTI